MVFCIKTSKVWTWCVIFSSLFFLFENKKITLVNREISSEYVDESMSYLLLLPMHSETVLSGFQGASICCNGKSEQQCVLRFVEGTVCVKTTVRIQAALEWTCFNSNSKKLQLQALIWNSLVFLSLYWILKIFSECNEIFHLVKLSFIASIYTVFAVSNTKSEVANNMSLLFWMLLNRVNLLQSSFESQSSSINHHLHTIGGESVCYIQHLKLQIYMSC